MRRHAALFLAAMGLAVSAQAAPREALRLAIEDLSATYPQQYTRGPEFLRRLATVSNDVQFVALQREALLAHPLLDGVSLLVVRRGERNLGLPWNWEGNSSLPQGGYDNEIMTLSDLRGGGTLSTLYRPEGGRFVGDVDLDFDGSRLLCSISGVKGRWRLAELTFGASNATPRQIVQIDEPDVDNYDACYLPDGDILFTSSAPFTGVPCVGGSAHVANLYRLDRASGAIRRLTFDQDHDWCPTVMNDGKVMYLRWEYSDIPHFVSRILFQMNPDGTDQREFYGSNSYWPNSTFFARPVPGSPGRFVGVVSGHHDTQRMGDLVLFDASKGRSEADGAVQRIPGRGKKVDPTIRDDLTKANWPKFLHPWPLSDKYFLVACKPSPSVGWGLYLADVFDNLVLIKEVPGSALLEPIPLAARPKPPGIVSRVRPGQKDATMYLMDVYAGPGLAGVPRGTVKKLRLFTYHFAYQGMGGQVNRIGFDGPWDIKRIIGTVPVEADGSAYFRVPANTPISMQPLDADGHALQLMRSWTTAMPGENQSCVGCHDRMNSGPPAQRTIAQSKPPAEITPWYGPTRGFSFRREVQPVLDRYCVSCHDVYRDRPDVPMGAAAAAYNQPFPPSYLELRRHVRTPTMESDMHLLTPGEFHADTPELFQLLRAGHHGVNLDAESADRLATWFDLNTPGHGTWEEIVGKRRVDRQHERRQEMMRRYANIDEDPEQVFPAKFMAAAQEPRAPESMPSTSVAALQAPVTVQSPEVRSIDLGGGVAMQLVKIPAAKPFWLGRCEVSNEQFQRFDSSHDSGIEVGDFLQFSVRERGWPVNSASQPVVRVSCQQAEAFCRWLSELTGLRCTLPDEARWESACRAGAATAMSYGGTNDNFAAFANLADQSFHRVKNYEPWSLPFEAVPPWRPAVESVDDGYHASAPVGHFRPNAWGLYDMHGNAAEWTSTDDGTGRRVVRGGAWSDLPWNARCDSRVSYPPWRRVFNVGFRVLCESEETR